MDCSGCAGWECIHYIRDKGRSDSAIQSGLPAQSIKVRTATTVLLLTLLQAGDVIIIVGTVDVSAYGEGADQEIFKEITAPECASVSFPLSPLALITVRPFSWFHLCQRLRMDLLER